MSPSILSGQICAYVDILSIVNDPNFLNTLKTNTNNNLDFWSELTNRFQENLMQYSPSQIETLSNSWMGTASLEHREGYRDVSSFIQRANTEVSKAQGSSEAVKEIIAFMKNNFPQFNPPGDISTPAQAEAAIGGFVNGLYGTINQLDITINNLNNVLLNANNRINQLQTVLDNVNKAAIGLSGTTSNLNRITNVLANTSEVYYWGSSVGVLHSVGSWISNWF